MRKTGLNSVEFTVFDTETTGLDPASDRIVEIAGVRIRGNKRLATFQTLVDPGMPVPPGASRVNGITDAMLAGAPRMEEVIPRFSEFIRGSCLCSYNTPFDMGFVTSEYRRAKVPFPDGLSVVDVLAMARQLLPLDRHPLWYVAQSLGIAESQQHRALSDVELTLGVFASLRKMLREREVATLADYVCLFGRGCRRYDELQREKIAGIGEAIERGARLRIRYFSRSEGRVTEREIIPKEVRTEGTSSYVTGFCCLKQGERTFKIEGILRLEPLDPSAPVRGRKETTHE